MFINMNILKNDMCVWSVFFASSLPVSMPWIHATKFLLASKVAWSSEEFSRNFLSHVPHYVFSKTNLILHFILKQRSVDFFYQKKNENTKYLVQASAETVRTDRVHTVKYMYIHIKCCSVTAQDWKKIGQNFYTHM